MRCHKCRGPAEEKVFTTFRYWYCGECKVEVDEKAAPAYVSFDESAHELQLDVLNLPPGHIVWSSSGLRTIRTGWTPPSANKDDTRLDDGEDDDASFGMVPNSPKDPSAADDTSQLSFDFWVNKP